MLELKMFSRKNNEVNKVKTKRFVIGMIGVLSLTVGTIAGATYTYMEAQKSNSVQTIAMKQSKNTKELLAKKEIEKVNIKGDTGSSEQEDPSPLAVEEEIVEEPVEQEQVVEEAVPAIVYDNLTLDQLSEKLNRSLSSTLSGQGYLFASYSLELGVDPYVAVAIALHETGCKWKCSTLVTQCNNVGGMKGSPSCGGGSYRSFPTLEAGIRSYLENLSRNYYSVGLTTPELMNSKYAASPTWAAQVNSYVGQIRAS